MNPAQASIRWCAETFWKQSFASSADEGRTVFFSTHLLDEVERVADDVAMMFDGRVFSGGRSIDVKACHHTLGCCAYETPQTVTPKIPRNPQYQRPGQEWTVICNWQPPGNVAATSASGRVMVDETPSLERFS